MKRTVDPVLYSVTLLLATGGDDALRPPGFRMGRAGVGGGGLVRPRDGLAD